MEVSANEMISRIKIVNNNPYLSMSPVCVSMSYGKAVEKYLNKRNKNEPSFCYLSLHLKIEKQSQMNIR